MCRNNSSLGIPSSRRSRATRHDANVEETYEKMQAGSGETPPAMQRRVKGRWRMRCNAAPSPVQNRLIFDSAGSSGTARVDRGTG